MRSGEVVTPIGSSSVVPSCSPCLRPNKLLAYHSGPSASIFDSAPLSLFRSPSKCLSDSEEKVCPSGEELPYSSMTFRRGSMGFTSGKVPGDSNPTGADAEGI